jgi:D-beta-D-heptose 7-phosphate kinase/D-beta-D-heptose 1-phosphate adenosyltransferase
VFDLQIHPGHVYSLGEAKKLADRLVVGVNSDASARLLQKGPGRPRLDERTRAGNVAAQAMVDLVVIFTEPTPRELLKELRPDFLVKGDDYRLDQVEGREFAGEVRLIPRLEGYSTSSLDAQCSHRNRR